MSQLGPFQGLLRRAISPWLELPSNYLQSLEAHYHLLLKWNQVVNLTKLTEVGEAIERHYAESLFLGSCCPSRPSTLADIGSGPGFPGIPLAAMWPDCRVTLVESDVRKAAFLRECRDFFPNLHVECVRAEHLSGGFEAFVARAVRPADVVRFARKNARTVGLLVAPSDVAGLKLEHMTVTEVPGEGKGVAVWGDVSRGTIGPVVA